MKELKINRAKYAVYGTIRSLLKAEKALKKAGYEGVIQNETARRVNKDSKIPLKFNWIIVYGGSRTYAYMTSNPTRGRFKAPDEIDHKELRSRLRKELKN